MRNLLASALAALVLLFGISGPVAAQNVPIIEATVGSGASTAYLVVDFGGASNFYTFAYLYDGTNVTAGDMITAIDTALSSFVGDMPGDRNSGFGRFVNGLGYGGNTLSSYTANFTTPPYFGWNYYVATSALLSTTPAWSSSAWGVDGRDSSNPAGFFQSLGTHSWHGFSWGQYDTNTFAFLGSTPRVQAGAAAPEPGSLPLLGIGALGLTFRRRRR
jgi:hypothetical protein